jgi:hypothetical protein
MNEREIQKSIVKYLRQVLPSKCIVHHSANEGVRGGKRGLIDGVRKKEMGQYAGFPDLLVLPYANIGALFFEVKAEGKYASEKQKEVHEQMRDLGYRVAVVRSVDDVRESLAEWGVGTQEITKEIPFRGVVT